MTAVRRWRIFYLIVVELAQKYTKALVAGFIAGLFLSVGFWKLYPFIEAQWLTPVDRIGIVGEFTPNALPLSIQQEISEGLTNVGPDGSTLPGLANTWVATDSGKTFTFFLRKDKVWQNNKPVTAKDVNYNIRNVTFTVIDDYTIKATLVSPYSPFPTLLSRPLFLPGLVGFGEFKVSAIKLNGDNVDYLKLVPVDLEKHKVRAREYRFYQTEAAAILAFKLGDVDTLEDFTSSYGLSRWGKTQVTQITNYNRIVTLFFNLSEGDLSDRAFRHSLAIALPDLPGEKAISPISKTSWAYTDKVKIYQPDFTAAKKQLSADKTASNSASFTLTTFPQYLDVAQKITDNWKRAGLAVDVKVVNSVPPNYQILLSTDEVPPDPDQYPFWHSTQTATNITGFSNVKIDKLLEDGRQEIDMETRKKIYADFQRRLVEEAPAIFLYYATSYNISRAR